MNPDDGMNCRPEIKAPIKSDDNWIHRSEGMRCHSCMYFVRKISERGRCRRHSPSMNGYPVVYETDWCGDHKLS